MSNRRKSKTLSEPPLNYWKRVSPEEADALVEAGVVCAYRFCDWHTDSYTKLNQLGTHAKTLEELFADDISRPTFHAFIDSD
jgi:hypothetical protein